MDIFGEILKFANMFLTAAEGKVIDITKRLEQKKQEEISRKETEAFLGHTGVSPENIIVPTSDELAKLRDRKFREAVQEKAGIWMHRFSDIRKDDQGFFILKQDNPAGNEMSPGHLLADYAINLTPYWKVTSTKDNRINLEPIGSNPFLTGIGAGGAKLNQYDFEVFTGKAEKERIERIQKLISDGKATIDDVKYLLDGTVPVNMGPNGAQGGWYNSKIGR